MELAEGEGGGRGSVREREMELTERNNRRGGKEGEGRDEARDHQ